VYYGRWLVIFWNTLPPLSSSKMEAAGTFKSMIFIYCTAWYHIPEDLMLTHKNVASCAFIDVPTYTAHLKLYI
jgi:hypothetical protein